MLNVFNLNVIQAVIEDLSIRHCLQITTIMFWKTTRYISCLL